MPRTSVNGSAVSVSVARRAVGVARELHATYRLAARPQAAGDAHESSPRGHALHVPAERHQSAHRRRALVGEANIQLAEPRGDRAAREPHVLRLQRATHRIPPQIAVGFDLRLDEFLAREPGAEIAHGEFRLRDFESILPKPHLCVDGRLPGQLLGNGCDPGPQPAGPRVERTGTLDPHEPGAAVRGEIGGLEQLQLDRVARPAHEGRPRVDARRPLGEPLTVGLKFDAQLRIDPHDAAIACARRCSSGRRRRWRRTCRRRCRARKTSRRPCRGAATPRGRRTARAAPRVCRGRTPPVPRVRSQRRRPAARRRAIAGTPA